jgi:ubiquinone/menaquinone biosynthesis C-methylase UbiE
LSSKSPPAPTDWDGSARAYDRFERRWHYYSRVAEGLVAPLGIERGSRVLELACGTGACTLVLSGRCPSGEVVCVERSAPMMDIARKNVKSAGRENVSFVQGDVNRLPELLAGEARFDFAVCNSAFWQFPKSVQVGEAVRRSLRPGGIFAFNLPSLFSLTRERRLYRDAMDEILGKHGIDRRKFWRRRKREDYHASLDRAGFTVVKDAHYDVVVQAREMMEWRSIPIFARRWGNFDALPADVSAEISSTIRKRRLLWPDDTGRRSRWRMIVSTGE